MTRYLVRQTLLSLLKLFVFVTLMFFFIQIMMPGDFVDQFALFLNRAEQDAMRAQLGLDLPLWQRYIQWLRQLMTLELGNSFLGEPIATELGNVMPPTLFVFFSGTALAFAIGLWLGKVTAWRGRDILSQISTLGGITLFTSFPPWLAWLLSYLFTRGRTFVVMGERGGLRGVSWRELDHRIWLDADISPSTCVLYMFLCLVASSLVVTYLARLVSQRSQRRIPGLLVLALIGMVTIVGWYLLGISEQALDIMGLAWLAIVAYTLLSFGETMLIMQSSMTEVLKEEYISTAQAKGLSQRDVRERHAARNAILPVLSRLVISLPYLITGVVIIESSVGWPGMGTSMWNALYWQNMPVVMTTLLIVGILSLIARLLLDLITAYLDPRIRYDYDHPAASA